MYTYCTTFFRKSGAKAFAAELKKQGIEPEIWEDRDVFGQHIYIVKWN